MRAHPRPQTAIFTESPASSARPIGRELSAPAMPVRMLRDKWVIAARRRPAWLVGLRTQGDPRVHYGREEGSDPGTSPGQSLDRGRRDQARSNRSRFITLTHATTKSL